MALYNLKINFIRHKRPYHSVFPPDMNFAANGYFIVISHPGNSVFLYKVLHCDHSYKMYPEMKPIDTQSKWNTSENKCLPDSFKASPQYSSEI